MAENAYGKKAVEFRFMSESVNATSAPAFNARVNALLEDGWDVLSSQSLGLDTGGGQAGGGNIMIFVTLVKYAYILLTPPADA